MYVLDKVEVKIMTKSLGYNFSMDSEVIGIHYLSLLKNVLDSEGFELCGYSGNLNELNDDRKRISPKEWCHVLTQSLDGLPGGLGFSYGKQLNLIAADTVGQLIMSCSTLKQALQSLQRFHLLLSISLDIEPELTGHSATVRFEKLYRRNLPLSLQWFATETLYACCLHQARWLSGQPLKFEAIKLPYSRPPHGQLYDSLFACNVEFDAPCHELVFNRESLDLPILTANEQLRSTKSQQCQRALRRWEGRLSVKEQVNAILTQTYPHFPSLEKVAEQLNTSRSCLYRKLQDKRTSYQNLINDFKKDQSMGLLRGTVLTVNEIAEELGFSDASSFRRAFKSWTGMQPSAVREERRQPS